MESPLDSKLRKRLSYLVGESTQAKKACGDPIRACSIGRAKAPVLPDPVCASPIRSLPTRFN